MRMIFVTSSVNNRHAVRMVPSSHNGMPGKMSEMSSFAKNAQGDAKDFLNLATKLFISRAFQVCFVESVTLCNAVPERKPVCKARV